MPPRIVTRYRRSPARVVAGVAGRSAGALLTLAGLVAAVVALPAVIGAGVLHADDALAADVPWISPGQATWLAIATVMVAIGLGSVGLRLLRRGRRAVLFLRRFEDVRAAQAVTVAAARAAGRDLRLVTLADRTIRPLGTTTGRRRGHEAGATASRALDRPWRVAYYVFFPGFFVAFAAYMTASLTGESAAAEAVIDALASWTIPVGSMGGDAVGVLAIAATVAAAAAAVIVGTVALYLAPLLVMPVVIALGSVGEAIREAESGKAVHVDSVPELAAAAERLEALSSRVIAPRLQVVRVTDDLWQEAVRTFAETTSAALVDVSTPTENLLWEIGEISNRLDVPCVFTCNEASVASLRRTDHAPGSVRQRLQSALGDAEVLAYRRDRAGARRFSRALRAKLAAT